MLLPMSEALAYCSGCRTFMSYMNPYCEWIYVVQMVIDGIVY